MSYVLYRNEGDGSFTDVSFPNRRGSSQSSANGMGRGLLDVDNSGSTFVVATNRHVMDNVERVNGSLRYLEPLLLLKQTGLRFIDVTKEYGAALAAPRRKGWPPGTSTTMGARPHRVGQQSGRHAAAESRAVTESLAVDPACRYGAIGTALGLAFA